jgi:myosin-crossreactive antigen
MTTESNTTPKSPRVYLNGFGLGSIAAAMYLIQKADFNPSKFLRGFIIFEDFGYL